MEFAFFNRISVFSFISKVFLHCLLCRNTCWVGRTNVVQPLIQGFKSSWTLLDDHPCIKDTRRPSSSHQSSGTRNCSSHRSHHFSPFFSLEHSQIWWFCFCCFLWRPVHRVTYWFIKKAVHERGKKKKWKKEQKSRYFWGQKGCPKLGTGLAWGTNVLLNCFKAFSSSIWKSSINLSLSYRQNKGDKKKQYAIYPYHPCCLALFPVSLIHSFFLLNL